MKNNSAINYLFFVLLLLSTLFSCKKEAIKTAPTATLSAITSITATSTTTGGDVTSDGGATITAKGVCWSTNQNPTTSDSYLSGGSGTGSFTSSITGLNPGTTYNLKAYATNSVGTGYSGQSSFTTLAIVPVLTTTDLSAVTSSTANSGGNITNDGGSAVTARGVCWGTNQNPTTADSKTTDGTGSGSFTSAITGLTPGSTYYVRAYATNSIGTGYGNQATVTVTAVVPVLTTTAISAITSTTAMSGGNITNNGGSAITARGICWGTTTNPTIANSKTTDGTGSGSFTSSITGLNPGMTYYVRAYATNGIGIAYGNELTAITSTIPPMLTTTAISSLTSASAISGGNITTDGGSAIIARGVCWGTTTNPTTANNKTTDGTGSGSFTSSITGLVPGTTYYIKAYATNGIGTAYGNEVTATSTAVFPTLTTVAVTSLTANSATSGGTITSDGGSAITARGVCWGTSVNPTTANSKTTDGTGSGIFASSITSLNPGTTFYIRAYATNGIGTAYGNQVTATASALLATLTTSSITDLTSTTATSGGNIISDGGSAITVRGVCWGTTANPTTANSKTTDGTGSGSFGSSITGLMPGTTYYVRAYATNGIGTSYGNEVSVSASAILPTLTTISVSALTSNSASSGGSITADGGSSVTSRGVCWGTSANPTTANNKTTDGTGSGSFASSITGLTPGTTYYIRAYATNGIGTAYGNQVTASATAVLATLTTSSITYLASTTATSGGNIISDGGSAITVRGVCWGTTANPTTASSKTTNGAGSGSFASLITGLTPGTTYYIWAYATNGIGTSYGNEITISALSVSPTLTTSAITGITTTSASSGGNITSTGGSSITVSGICWSITPGPTVANSKTSGVVGSGSFISSLTGLTVATTYYVRSYATNSAGTGYGNEISFTTAANLATLSTTTISALSFSTGTSGGIIASDGGGDVLARGVCWSTSVNPTISDNKTIDGSGIGTYASSITGLTATTTYYLRAYATNSAGVSYGNQINFTTPVEPPYVTDIDGNKYHMTTIGVQVWMTENLKTTKYNDGTIIPMVSGNSVWKGLNTAAYCWYNNDEVTNKNPYGALYNFKAASTNTLCPVGWHVPSNDDWTTLKNYLGSTSLGGKLKETGTNHWISPNTGAINSVGFTAVPGGVRMYNDGSFQVLGQIGNYWSSTADLTWNLYFFQLKNINDIGDLYYSTYQNSSNDGLSVRCIKD